MDEVDNEDDYVMKIMMLYRLFFFPEYLQKKTD